MYSIALFVLGLHLQAGSHAPHGLVFQVGGDGQDVQFIDLEELFRLGQGRTGHAGQLFVHAEVVLQGDGGVGDVFRLDLHAFFGFHGLVQAIGPAPAGHQAAGELIHDDHLAALDQVILVALEQVLGAQGLFQKAEQVRLFGGDIFGAVGVAQGLAEQLFDMRGADFGQGNGCGLFR